MIRSSGVAGTSLSLILFVFSAVAADAPPRDTGQAQRNSEAQGEQGDPQAPPPVSPRPGSGGGPPPPYTPVRWNEDYGYLRDPARRTDPFDPLKYIPLGDDPTFYLSLGGQARYRYELFNNNNFGAGPQDDTGYHLTRLLLHADLHAGEHLRGFLQLKSAMEDGRAGGPRPTDADEFDIQQGFVDLKLPAMFLGDDASALTLRGGRQEMIYGAQRLIGPLDWANVRRTFDGGKAIIAFSKEHSLDLFWVRPVIFEREEFNVADGETDFAGLYDTLSLPKVFSGGNSKLELYGLYLNRREGSAFPTEGSQEEERYTLGTRFSATPKPFDVDVELDYQFGNYGGGDISAWAAAFEGGYTLADVPLTPRPFLGFDLASGDDDAGDGDLQTFNQLFPTGHPHLGYIDAIGRQNIMDLRGGLELTMLQDKPYVKKATLRTEYHQFWRESDADAVYNAGGAVLRPPGASDARSIGGEIDFLLNWQIDRHLSAYFGYSHFFAGEFIEETGPSGDIDFFYAAFQFTF